jgi:hypothetical protein
VPIRHDSDGRPGAPAIESENARLQVSAVDSFFHRRRTPTGADHCPADAAGPEVIVCVSLRGSAVKSSSIPPVFDYCNFHPILCILRLTPGAATVPSSHFSLPCGLCFYLPQRAVYKREDLARISEGTRNSIDIVISEDLVSLVPAAGMGWRCFPVNWMGGIVKITAQGERSGNTFTLKGVTSCPWRFFERLLFEDDH